MGDCELSFRERVPLDIELALVQHDLYEAQLRKLGCNVVRLPALPENPDSVFVEDTAVVLEQVAIMTRPGAVSRSGEVVSSAIALDSYRELRYIDEPATLDGGDVLVVGRHIYVGETARTNREGYEQLRRVGREHGYVVESVAVHGCLHLKSAATQVGVDMLLANPAMCDATRMARHKILRVAPDEPDAANGLLINGCVIYPDSNPNTAGILEAEGTELVLMDVSEVQKAEGGVTCGCVVFEG